MHELAITTEIVDMIHTRMEARARRDPFRIKRVVLEIGKLVAVLPDSVRFCFDLCAAGTFIEGASLEIIETPGAELKIKEVEVTPCAEHAAVSG